MSPTTLRGAERCFLNFTGDYMSKRRFAVNALFLALCGLATACAADGANDAAKQDAFDTLNPDDNALDQSVPDADAESTATLAQLGGGDLDRNGPHRVGSYSVGFPRVAPQRQSVSRRPESAIQLCAH